MKTGIVLMGLVVLLLLTAVIPVAGGRSATALYYSPVFIALLAALAGLCVWCCLRRRRGLRQVGFLLSHLGVVVILAGAMAGFLFGVRGNVRLPVNMGRFVDRILLDGQDAEHFGFEVGARDFEVDFYPPTYRIWKPLPPDEIVPGEMPYVPGEEFATEGASEWDLPAQPAFAVSNLWNSHRSDWLPQYNLSDGSILAIARQSPKFFGFTLLVRDDGELMELPVAVNHPASYGGWRFYLMSYDTHARAFVDVSARRDPGRGAVIAGIWILIVGVFILSFRREKRGGNGLA